MCSCYRKEVSGPTSSWNRQAVAATRAYWGDPPSVPSAVGPVGMVTFIDRSCVQPIKVRGVPTWGYSWTKAGWEVIGETKGGLLAMGMRLDRMPEPEHANEGTLFDVMPHQAVRGAGKENRS